MVRAPFYFANIKVGAFFYSHCKQRRFAMGFVPSKFRVLGTFLTYWFRSVHFCRWHVRNIRRSRSDRRNHSLILQRNAALRDRRVAVLVRHDAASTPVCAIHS